MHGYPGDVVAGAPYTVVVWAFVLGSTFARSTVIDVSELGPIRGHNLETAVWPDLNTGPGLSGQ